MDAGLRCHDLTLYDDIAKWTLDYDVMVIIMALNVVHSLDVYSK